MAYSANQFWTSSKSVDPNPEVVKLIRTKTSTILQMSLETLAQDDMREIDTVPQWSSAEGDMTRLPFLNQKSIDIMSSFCA
jgi:hypothetical protein